MEQAVYVYHLLRTQYLLGLARTGDDGRGAAARELEQQVRQAYEAVWTGETVGTGFRAVDGRWAAPSRPDDHSNYVRRSKRVYLSDGRGLRAANESKTVPADVTTLGGWWQTTQERLARNSCADTAAYADLHRVLYDGTGPLLGRPATGGSPATGLFAVSADTLRAYKEVRALAGRLAWTASNVRTLPPFPPPDAQGPDSGTVDTSLHANCCPVRFAD